MKYCCKETDRMGSCYHEFKKGEYDETFWSADSIYLHDDYMDKLGLEELFSSVFTDYDRYGITQFSKKEWQCVCEQAVEMGKETNIVIEEINFWMQEVFQTHLVVTILGI